ncbi:MAG: helix-turn-helix transcriptional regulator [Lentisphaeria bacterium]|nr:helix-turn-helix transcriptional regulator [Lentisphaeria bacterium]
MMISYNKLWKRMIDCGMNKTQLREKAGVSTNVIAKLGKGENVTTDVLVKICKALQCDIADILEICSEEK